MFRQDFITELVRRRLPIHAIPRRSYQLYLELDLPYSGWVWDLAMRGGKAAEEVHCGVRRAGLGRDWERSLSCCESHTSLCPILRLQSRLIDLWSPSQTTPIIR
jgi:hypothetical protein